MTTLSMRHPQDNQQHLHGWAASFLIHGVAVALSVALVSSLRLPPEPKVFKWDVAVVERPSPVPAEETAPADPVPAPTAPTPVPPKPMTKAQSQPVESRQVVQAVERVEAVQTVRSVEPVVQQEVRSATPIMRERLAATEPAPRQSAPVVDRPVQSVEAAPQTLPAAHETTPVVESSPVPLAPETQVVAVAPVVRQEARSRIPVAAAAPARIVPTHQKKSEDYAWLVDALKKSLQKVRPTLERGGKLRLMLKVRQDGNQVDLVDLAVAESSGYVAVDRKAIEVVRQAFPLEHAGRLESPEVSINMPFRLDLLETR